MHFCGSRVVSDALLKFDLCGVESADDHQVAAENLVGVGVFHVELERLRQGLN